MPPTHPKDALFQGEKPFPIIPSCEHYAGSEKLIQKALDLQRARGGGFDVTMDLEDGAPEGHEKEHAEMVLALATSPVNALHMTGVRIHPYQHPHWRRDVDIVLGGAGGAIAYVTIPKATDAAHVREMVSYVHAVEQRRGLRRKTPVHVLIETHGALRDVFEIAAISSVQVLDFGLMDFVSDHHGAIPEECMRSPGQFEHGLLRRAKTEIVAAALANGAVPSHNVTLELRDRARTFEDARRARTELGFLRMWSIHPEQIEPIIEAMKPDLSAATRAGEILLRAQRAEWGPVEVDGKLHDRATYRFHWELLQRAHLAGTPLGEEVEQAFFAPRL